MSRNLERVINVLKGSTNPLTKVDIINLGGKANSSKLRLLVKMGLIKRIKNVIPVDFTKNDKIIGAEKIRDKAKREMTIAKLKAKIDNEKIYYTYEIVLN